MNRRLWAASEEMRSHPGWPWGRSVCQRERERDTPTHSIQVCVCVLRAVCVLECETDSVSVHACEQMPVPMH